MELLGRWDYTPEEWARRVESKSLPWPVPALIGSLITLWCLKMGFWGGVSQHSHQPVPPDPYLAFVVFTIGGIPFLGLAAYAFLTSLRNRGQRPGSLAVGSEGVFMVDPEGFPLSAWLAEEEGSGGTWLESLRLDEQGLQLTCRGRLKAPHLVGPISVPAQARADLGTLLEQVQSNLTTATARRGEGAGQASPSAPAQKSGQSAELLVRRLGPLTFVSATVPRLPVPVGGALAGLGCFGYMTVIAFYAVWIGVVDHPGALAPWLWMGLLPVGMLTVLLVGVVKVLRSFPESLHLRIDPEWVELRARGHSTRLPRAQACVSSEGNALLLGEYRLEGLPADLADRMAALALEALA